MRRDNVYLALTLLCITLMNAASALEQVAITLIGADPTASTDQTVPAWTGGLALQAKNAQGHHTDPYASEQPLFVLDASNYQAHQERLSPGLIALLTNYPDTLKIPIYPSHRSASYPDWYYQNIERERPEPKLTANSNGIEHAFAGTHFPRPSNGLEAIWNHLTRWRGRYTERSYTDAIVYHNGTKKLINARQEVAFELFRKGRAMDDEHQVLLYYSSFITSPPNLAGGALLLVDYLNQHQTPRQSWMYDASQHRVKRMPYVTYDSPAIMAESLRTADDTDMYNGSPDLYDWQLLGKRIMYIPYNSYRVSSPEVSYNQLLTPHHLNPKFTRFEAHRVWVVEATLKPGKYHVYPKRTFYLDEDSWAIAIADQYDHQGNIWRVSLANLANYYEVPMIFSMADVFHDLKSKNYHVGNLTNEEPSSGDFLGELPDPSYFTPGSLRARVR